MESRRLSEITQRSVSGIQAIKGGGMYGEVDLDDTWRTQRCLGGKAKGFGVGG